MEGIRKIYLKVYLNGTVISDNDILGFIGEHMVTTLVFEFPSKLKNDNYTYMLNFEDDTGKVWSGTLLDDYTFIIPMELTQNKFLRVQLTVSERNNVVFKSNCIEFKLHNSVDVNDVSNKYIGLLEDTLNNFDNLVKQIGSKDLSKLKGVVSIEKTAINGLQDTYTVTYTDATTSTFIITNGSKGDKGENYVLTNSDKLEIAKIVSEEYPASAYKTVTPYTAYVSYSGLTVKEEIFEEGEI